MFPTSLLRSVHSKSLTPTIAQTGNPNCFILNPFHTELKKLQTHWADFLAVGSNINHLWIRSFQDTKQTKEVTFNELYRLATSISIVLFSTYYSLSCSFFYSSCVQSPLHCNMSEKSGETSKKCIWLLGLNRPNGVWLC